MKTDKMLLLLCALIVILAVIASGVGLFYQDGGSEFSFTTVRGETVQMYGQGLYRFETLRDGTGFKGVDLYVLLVAVPLLAISAWLYRAGSCKGGLVLTGTLAYLFYNSASMTFGYAYNNLFLVYLLLLTCTFAALVLAYRSFEGVNIAAHFGERLPRRGIAAFLVVVGTSLILVWAGLDILPALLAGSAPPLTGHTTLPTHALDMGIVAPLAFIASRLLLRRTQAGYLLSAVLLIVCAVLGGGVLALSAAQVLGGVLTVPQIVGFVVPFVILTGFGLLLTVMLFRNFSDRESADAGARGLRTAHA